MDLHKDSGKGVCIKCGFEYENRTWKGLCFGCSDRIQLEGNPLALKIYERISAGGNTLVMSEYLEKMVREQLKVESEKESRAGRRIYTHVGDVFVQIYPTPSNEIGLGVTRPEGTQITYLTANMLRVLILTLKDALGRIDEGRA